eukprot:2241653-Prymnesium_polylepis.2
MEKANTFASPQRCSRSRSASRRFLAAAAIRPSVRRDLQRNGTLGWSPWIGTALPALSERCTRPGQQPTMSSARTDEPDPMTLASSLK